MKKLYYVFIPIILTVFNACYDPPENLDITPVNPDTPENWNRIKYSKISNDNDVYMSTYYNCFIYDEDTNLYVFSGSGYLLVFKDTSDIQILELEGSSSRNLGFLKNSKNEIFVSQYKKLLKLEDNNLIDQELLEQYSYLSGGEYTTYTSTPSSFECVVFDNNDIIWFIDGYNYLFRQISGSNECARIPDSLINLNDRSYKAVQLFNIDNEIWVLNSNDEMFKYSSTEDSFKYMGDMDFGTNSIIKQYEHDEVSYFKTDDNIFTFSNNLFHQLSLSAYDRDGYSITEYEINGIDFDQDDNMLLTDSEFPILFKDGIGNVIENYYEDDYIFYLHTKTNQHIIIGSEALYLISDL